MITAKNAFESLPKLREKFGKTIKEVAEKSNISKVTIIAIEKGRVQPQAPTVHKLNQYFDLLGN
jgi:DNA-binding XRE family transcriptional regulator